MCNGPLMTSGPDFGTGGFMQAPRVSVVIPAYNSAWSIADTIRSVLAQRMVAFEVVIVNDGSTDDLLEVLRPFMSDSRLRVVSQANSGLAAARNRGLAESRAPLVAFLDADDLWHPSFLAELGTAALGGEPKRALCLWIFAAHRPGTG
jgi:glycosyltransferase involved in cell wall biosynthesis